MKCNIIKSTSWTTSTGKTGATYTVNLRGRVLVVNLEDFESSEYVLDTVNQTIEFKCELEYIKESYIQNGVQKTGLRLKPVFGLNCVDA